MAKRKGDVSQQRQVGERIRERRIALERSGFDVAKAADVGKYHYYVIERGETAVTAATLGRIAKVLGVSAHYLLTGEHPPKRNGNGKKNGGKP